MSKRALLAAAVATGLASGVWAAVPSSAARPETAPCWGRCGGDSGPLGGYFTIVKGSVSQFRISEKCLGMNHGLEDEVIVAKNMPITAAGSFSFSGEGQRTSSSTTTSLPVKLSVQGDFTTPARAAVTLTIGYGSCAMQHVTILAQ